MFRNVEAVIRFDSRIHYIQVYPNATFTGISPEASKQRVYNRSNHTDRTHRHACSSYKSRQSSAIAQGVIMTMKVTLRAVHNKMIPVTAMTNESMSVQREAKPKSRNCQFSRERARACELVCFIPGIPNKTQTTHTKTLTVLITIITTIIPIIFIIIIIIILTIVFITETITIALLILVILVVRTIVAK